MNSQELNKILKKYPEYRLVQAKKAIYQNLISNWSLVTELPKELREKLIEAIPLKIKADILVSSDKKTKKAKIYLEDGNRIESVLMESEKRNTICISTQVGCGLGCIFCQTGKMGFIRNLTDYEIINQLLFFSRLIFPKKITNIVFMGMGEPFLNYNNLFKAIDVINDKNYFNIGARNISVSTVGIVDKIKEFADQKKQINLAISLHFVTDDKREKYIPINKKYPLKDIFDAIDYYTKKTNRKVMYEYILFDGINDTDKDIENIVKILGKRLHLLNIINYNQGSKKKNINNLNTIYFKKRLEKKGLNVAIRKSFGNDINSACGELAIFK